MAYFTRDREAGNMIEWFDTREEAERAIEKYEADDRKEGTYTEDFYEVATENHVPMMYRIKATIQLAGLSQVDFAERFEIPLGTVHNWCQGIAEPTEWVWKLIENELERS